MRTHTSLIRMCLSRDPIAAAPARALLSMSIMLMTSVAFAMGPSDDAPAAMNGHISEPAQRTSQTVLGAPVFRKTFVSPLYEIDGIYRSMKGPNAADFVGLAEPDAGNELFWITAQHTEIVSGDEGSTSSPEFMCHSNLGMTRNKRHEEIFGSQPGVRLFTLSQGQMDVRFPEGYGLPVMSRQPLELETQVLNLNPQSKVMNVRHRVTVEYVRQSEIKTAMKPLRVLSAQGMVAIDETARHYGVTDADPEQHGPGCSVGAPAGSRGMLDETGNRFAAHWIVKPGREENRTLVTHWMNVPFDTTVHFIAVHLHPFAQSATLTDLTSGKNVFRSHARGPENRIGLTHVESYVSKDGMPIFAGHEYELTSIYENTTEQDQDSMAVMFLYVLDRAFKLPARMAAN